MRLPDMDGLEILSRIKTLRPETEVIIITGYKSVESAVEAIRKGAFHYIAKPVNLSEIRLLVNSVREKIAMRMENQRLREALNVITSYSIHYTKLYERSPLGRGKEFMHRALRA